MRSFALALTALALSLGFASLHATQTQEKKTMNVKRITPVLLVKEIEPIVPFWVDRLGFTKTVEVPDGNKLGFVAFQKGTAEVMYQTYASVEKDAPPSMAAEARKGPTYLYMEVDNFRRRSCCHEGRENRHARSHRLLRHERIRRPGSRRPLHHLRPASRRAAALEGRQPIGLANSPYSGPLWHTKGPATLFHPWGLSEYRGRFRLT